MIAADCFDRPRLVVGPYVCVRYTREHGAVRGRFWEIYDHCPDGGERFRGLANIETEAALESLLAAERVTR